ncbi:NUDIX domain-containing protein [Sporosarcina cyprini]|uniref:NUDIX domain-containing protein n=1 Tax=Sporosarcina cyprini TaxID=2910523 RepID=UPI001EE0CDA6|nr:NUDIX domain-containing protein [Sporosarcina cyprini]
MTARGNVWLGAAGLVINSNGEWLVVKKTYGGLKGFWSLPAGFVEGGETADQAAIREVKEETGIETELVGMIGFRTGVLNGAISDNMAIFLLKPSSQGQMIQRDTKEIAVAAWQSPFELKDGDDVSLMLKEMAEKTIESGLFRMKDRNPGDWFGYTAYKLFFSE